MTAAVGLFHGMVYGYYYTMTIPFFTFPLQLFHFTANDDVDDENDEILSAPLVTQKLDANEKSK